MRSAPEILALVAAGVVPNLAYLVIGCGLLRAFRLRATGAERLALAFALGTGAASLALLLLRACDAPLPFVAVLAVAAAGAPLLRSGEGSTSARAAPVWLRCVDGATVVVAAASFAAALAPETFWDGFEYHLPIVRAWTEGPIRALPAMIDAEFRAGIDLLYLPAVAWGQPDAAAAVSACFALSLAALVRAEAMRRATPGAGALAALFALTVPFALDNAPSTYTDLGAGTYGFLALLQADRWNRGGDRNALFASALFLAFAANAKLHTVILCPAVLGIVLAGGRVPAWRTLAGCGLLFSALAAPWLVKSAHTTGNPFFPFLGEWFGYGDTTREFLEMRRHRLSTDFPAPRNALGFLYYVASANFGRNPHVSGLVGPLVLALAPLAWHRLSRSTAAAFGAIAALFVLQFAFMPALRFGSALLPFLAVAAAVGGARLAASGALARRVLTVSIGGLVLHHAAAAAARYAPRIVALRHPAAYERAVFPDQVALREVVARAEPVVAIPKGAIFWMPKPVYNLHWERNGELVFNPRSRPAAVLAQLRRRGVRSLVIDVPSPLPGDGSVGHPVVDAWLRSGTASLRSDSDPTPARPGRVWVLVDLGEAAR